MSPSASRQGSPPELFEDDLNLSIVGLGVEYPPYATGPETLEILAKRFYPESTALTKVLSINRFTGIQTRSSIGDHDHPLVNKPTAPTINELNEVFMTEGVPLSVSACKKAIAEWGGDPREITHMVSTTCTNSANPGFDYFVAKQLGLNRNIEKALLHGIGCSGGMAAIRTAANLALGSTQRKRPARILVLACELCTTMVRSELDSINENREVRIGVCLFSDCASACIVTNGIGDSEGSQPVYDVLGWKHEVLEDTAHDLGFDVDPLGWKVVLSPRVPSFTSACVAPAFQALLASVPSLHRDGSQPRSTDFDWALHPGGSTILSGVQQAMGLSEEQLMASYHTYVEHGNSSSATIMSVMDRMRRSESKKEDVIACAFGPGINLEMMALKRRKWAIDAPSLTNGHSVVQEAVETNGHGASNRVVEQQVNGSTGGPSLNHETQGLSHAAETNGSRVVVSASAGGSDRLRNDTFSRNETNETTKTPMTLDGVNGLPAEDLD